MSRRTNKLKNEVWRETGSVPKRVIQLPFYEVFAYPVRFDRFGDFRVSDPSNGSSKMVWLLHLKCR